MRKKILKKISNIDKFKHVLFLISFIVAVANTAQLQADETKSDTLRFIGKSPIKTYAGDIILVNAHKYTDIDKEDADLNTDVFVPCQTEVSLDMDELSSYVKYPDLARRAGITGTVYVKCLIGRNNKLLKVLVEMSDNELLNQSAIDAVCKVQSWQSAVQKGEKVAMWISVPIEYNLTPAKKTEK